MPTSIRAHLATQPDSATLESLAMLADRALASETDVEESKPGVAEIKVDETTKLVGLLEDLSKRLNKLAEKKRNSGRGRANNNYAPRTPFVLNAQASLFLTNKVIVTMQSKIFVRTYRHRMHSKIMSRNRPTQPLHRFATTTKILVKRRACAVNPARTVAH